MTYRKYCQDEVILIEASDTEGALGFSVMKGSVTDQPAAVPPHVPLGMFVLREVPPPGLELRPEAFIAGSRSMLERVADTVENTFSRHLPEVVAEWIIFRDEDCPQDDDAGRYMREKGMYVPFKDVLFGGGIPEFREANVSASSVNPTDITFTNSMQWSGRGSGREKVSNVPYISSAGSTAASAASIGRVGTIGRKRQSERSPSLSSESSSDEPSYNYIDLLASDGKVSYFKFTF